MLDPREDLTKAKYRDALDKKRKVNNSKKVSESRNSKVSGEQTPGTSPRIFRRKSGSA
jgi:hypothetical protein